jgi:hypothetical protein
VKNPSASVRGLGILLACLVVASNVGFLLDGDRELMVSFGRSVVCFTGHENVWFALRVSYTARFLSSSR